MKPININITLNRAIVEHIRNKTYDHNTDNLNVQLENIFNGKLGLPVRNCLCYSLGQTLLERLKQDLKR